MSKVTKKQAEAEVEAAHAEYVKRRVGRPKIPKAIAYPEEIQVMMKAFINERREDAISAYQSAETIAATAPDLPGSKNQLEYWKRVLQALDWIESYVHRKQRHLIGVKF